MAIHTASANGRNLATDPLPLNQLRFGDFNGDGKTDVFSVDGSGQWRWSEIVASATGKTWRPDTLGIADLRLATSTTMALPMSFTAMVAASGVTAPVA